MFFLRFRWYLIWVILYTLDVIVCYTHWKMGETKFHLWNHVFTVKYFSPHIFKIVHCSFSMNLSSRILRVNLMIRSKHEWIKYTWNHFVDFLIIFFPGELIVCGNDKNRNTFSNSVYQCRSMSFSILAYVSEKETKKKCFHLFRYMYMKDIWFACCSRTIFELQNFSKV